MNRKLPLAVASRGLRHSRFVVGGCGCSIVRAGWGKPRAAGCAGLGNRTAFTQTTPLAGTTVTTYTYDAANRLLVSASHPTGTVGVSFVSYTWDARGNLLSDGTFTYRVLLRLVGETG